MNIIHYFYSFIYSNVGIKIRNIIFRQLIIILVALFRKRSTIFRE